MESDKSLDTGNEWQQFIYVKSESKINRGSFAQVYKATNKLYEGNFAIKKVDIAKVHRYISIQLLNQKHLQSVDRRGCLDITIKSLLNERNSSIVNNYDHIIKSDTCWFQGPNRKLFSELRLHERLPDIKVDIEGSSGPPTGLDFFYFVMEWCESNLTAWLEASKGVVNMSQLYEFWKGILLGLEELERRKIIHRDIKPSNILLKQISGERFVAKIGDFGLSTPVQERSTPWRIMKVGTENYKSPEMRDMNASYDYKTDIFSAGIMFTECLYVYRNGSCNLLLENELYSSFKSKTVPLCVEESAEKQLIIKMCNFNVNDRADASKSLLLLREITSDETNKSRADSENTRAVISGKSIVYQSGFVQRRNIYQVYVESEIDLAKLLKEVQLKNQLLLWSVVPENPKIPVQILSQEKEFTSFIKDFLLPSGLKCEIVDSNVSMDFSSSKLSRQAKTIKVKSIQGTSLFTGIYYKLRNKRFPSGIVTYTSHNFLQIDLDPKQIPLYDRGEKWYHDDQWVFMEDPNYPGWYEIKNKVIFDGVTTWSSKKIGSGYHIVLIRKQEDVKQLSIGVYHMNVLWQPVKMKDSDYYKLKNKNYPNGTITWTEQKYRNVSHYIQVDLNPEHVNYYEPGQKWHDDALFSFTPVPANLHGKIHSCHYEVDLDIFSFDNSTTTNTRNHVYTVHNSTNETIIKQITEEFSDNIILNFVFNSTFKCPFEDVKLVIKMPVYDEQMLNAVSEVTLEPGKVNSVSIPNGIVLSKEVRVPVGETAQVFAESKWISDDFPFTASLKITGTSDDREVVSPDVIEQQLKNDLKGYDTQKAEEDASLNVKVSGILKGGFWYRRLVV